MKVDKSLQEVWDWKDKVYEETKYLSVKKMTTKVHEDVQQIKKKYGLKLKMLHPSIRKIGIKNCFHV